MNIRSTARSAALSGAGSIEKLLRHSALSRPRTHFVYLHSLPEGEVHNFRELLRLLTSKMDFVSYSDAVDFAAAGQPDRARFCLSADDAFRSNLRLARVAEEFSGSVCFFVPTGLVGSKTLDEVASFFRMRSLIEDSALTWQEISSLRERGHEIGSHTVSHPNLSKLNRAGIVEELEQSRSHLSERIGPVKHFAWPYGGPAFAPQEMASIAAEVGYASTASAIRGAHIEAIDPSKDFLFRDNYDSSWPTIQMAALLARSSRKAT